MFYILNNRLYILPVLYFFGIFTAIGQQYTKAVSPSPIPLDSLVKYGKLDNGFTYYIRQNHTPEKRILFNLIVKAGTFHEDKDQIEYAHLLEHMGAKATIQFSHLKNFFNSSGGYRSASTSPSYTTYLGSLPSEDKHLWKKGLQIVRGWAQGIPLDKESIKVEREAVLAEMRESSNPSQSRKNWILRRIMLLNTGFKKYNLDKSKTSIQNFNYDKFIQFYEDWYRPDLQAAIIVGDVNPDSVENEIKRMFSNLEIPIKRKSAYKITSKYAVNLSGHNQYITVIDSVWHKFELNIWSKYINRKWQPKTIKDYEALVIQQLSQEILKPRIEKTILKQYNPPFNYFNQSYNYTDRAALGMRINFNINDSTNIKNKVIKALICLKSISTNIKEKDLQKAKFDLLKKYSNHLIDIKSSRLAERYRAHFTRGAAAPNLVQEQKLIVKLLKQVNLNSIREHIRISFDLKRNSDFIFFTPNKNIKIPDSALIKKWISQVDKLEIPPYTDQLREISSLKELAQLSFKNKTTEVISENMINVTTIQLENGIKIWLKPNSINTKVHSGKIQLRAYRPNNFVYKNKKEYLTATIAGDVIKYSGIDPFNKFELENYMDDNGINTIDIGLDYFEQTIYGNCKEESLESMLELLYLYFTKPRKSLEAFSEWKLGKKNTLLGNTPGSRISDYFDKAIKSKRLGIPLMDVPTLNSIGIEQVYQIYNKQFSNFDGFTFIITGDYNKERVKSILVKYLSNFNKVKTQTKKFIRETPITLQKLDSTIYINHLNRSLIRLFFPTKVPTDIKTKVALSIIARALHNRIWNRLRKGCYSPSAYGNFREDRKGLFEFIIDFDSKLGDQKRMIHNALEEFNLLKDKGITKEELENLTTMKLIEFDKRINNKFPLFWNDYLKVKSANNEPPETEILQSETILRYFIDIKYVNKIAKKYLKDNYLQKFVALPKKDTM